LADIPQEDLIELIQNKGQGYNKFIFEKNQTLKDICQNDKSFNIDFEAYLRGFDGETRDLLGVDATEGEKFLDIKGVIAKLNAKKVLLGYTQEWSSIDLKPFNNSEITTLEEHIKRRWADISAETAGEQYTPDDVIGLIAEIIASNIEDSDRLLKIYDCTCGGGNLLFGVEDRINAKVQRLTQTFGQDWNDALYALAKIESRFRLDSKILHGNTLTDDKFDDGAFDVVIANPPYGVSWKGYEKAIKDDKTQRFKYLPSISDGQLLFMQHLISKLSDRGMGVVVHNGSTLFSGDAGSAESNIRKWMLDIDIVEAVIQLPTDEFFNTGIYTYLWVLNKRKSGDRQDKVMLINASEKFKPLKKNKGSKRKEIDEVSRLEIVETLARFVDNDYARVFEKEFFYFNKQGIILTNIDSLDYKEQPLMVTTDKAVYSFDSDRETIIKQSGAKREELGCGKFVVKAAFKKASKTQAERIEITVELTPDYQKDYEIIPFHRDEVANREAIAAFMAKYITKPFEYLENVVGVEINFNKVFYKPEKLRSVEEILEEIVMLDEELKELEKLIIEG
jgi:type I restriction enzyme M protein